VPWVTVLDTGCGYRAAGAAVVLKLGPAAEHVRGFAINKNHCSSAVSGRVRRAINPALVIGIDDQRGSNDGQRAGYEIEAVIGGAECALVTVIGIRAAGHGLLGVAVVLKPGAPLSTSVASPLTKPLVARRERRG